MRYYLFGLILAVSAAGADLAENMAQDYLALREVPQLRGALSYHQALRFQEQFVRQLVPKLGKPVGFKVGLVTKEAQDQFHIQHPIRGRLLSKMILTNDSEVPLQYGVRPVCEADLVVVVKDSEINKAEDMMAVLRNIEEVVAFIELADSFLVTNPPVSGLTLTAANAGARYGVLGGRVRIKPKLEFLHALAQMRVTIRDDSGATLGEGRGKVILSHPLNAILWLVEDLRRTGQKLRAGDLISVGSIKAFTPAAGQRITVTYQGLGTPIHASVQFK